jgi:hypothetical protein
MTDEEMARKCAADLEDPGHQQLYIAGFLDGALWKRKDLIVKIGECLEAKDASRLLHG